MFWALKGFTTMYTVSGQRPLVGALKVHTWKNLIQFSEYPLYVVLRDNLH